MQHPSFRFASRCLSLAALAASMLGCGLAARAQFNGPALPPSATVNRPTQITNDPSVLYPAFPDVQLTPGDVITVRVFGIGDYTATARVAVDGSAVLPLLGTVRLGGLTVSAAQALIAQKMQDAGLFRDPQVGLTIVEGPSSTVTLIGEMHGVIPVAGRRRLLDVLAAAGGLPPTASHIITINRPGQAEPITVDLGTDPARSALADVPVLPGDTVVVARVGVVYMVGAFKNNAAIPLVQNSPLTLLQATTLAGGPVYSGKFNDLRIIRTVGNTRTLVKVDMKRVLYGHAPDPVLQSDDIVFLPTDALKAAIASGGISTLLSIASILVIAIRQ